MHSIKYSIPVAILTWWIPFLGGIITGLISGFSERKISHSIASSAIASIIASSLYILVFVKIVKIPILGNLLPVVTIILCSVSTIISIVTAYFISSNIVRFSSEGNSAKIEFYAKNQEEIEEKIKPYENGCGDPQYSFYGEDKVVVTRKCNGFILKYEIEKEGKRYKVSLYLEGA
ncbi:hypothetical protein DFR86_07860 [Acidianus sulfidivorans JP7]|uniref:Uncharacterized protein n=1 Tax=Acidianus sulfidivorans JP7 TaxID=619593 RepID=A0A2U9IN91_9CREN|nr:hypothetical protein [Acidianus sulfidivorans]AWR97472.1 hypothetical protein DFR86_07860 [Acidianus sulfidivorans JP7]